MTQLPAGIEPWRLANWQQQMAAYQQRQGQQQGQGELDLILQLLQQQGQAQLDARNANEERYHTVLDRDIATRDRILSSLGQYGAQQVSDVNRDYDTQRNNLLTDLAERGLSGSTARIPVESKVKRERDAAVNRLKDSHIMMQTGADERMSNRLSDFQERRTDSYPQPLNMGAYGALGHGGGTNVRGLPSYGSKLGSGAAAFGTNVSGIPNGSQQVEGGAVAYGRAGSGRNPFSGGQRTGAPLMPRPVYGQAGPQAMNPSEQVRERQNSMFALQQADQGQMGASRNFGGIADAQRQAILGGYGSYQQGQRMPTVPGMAGESQGLPVYGYEYLDPRAFQNGGQQQPSQTQSGQATQSTGWNGIVGAITNAFANTPQGQRRAREEALRKARANVMPGVAQRKRARIAQYGG